MKKKIVLSFLLMCINVFAGVFCVSAYDGTSYGNSLYYTEYSTFVKITDCDNSVYDVVIPSQINGKPVWSIGRHAFEECYNLIYVTIPDSVFYIDDYAFYDCVNLEKVNNFSGVKSIDYRAV